ncbi:MAG: CRISPR-associated helicase Cas3 [Candidatus Methanohalarchaeum thermophilum]|uniref:CRISPR-associated helicase Cas3 n=1 Tax=Methanohalarchaeum thermophilum TaxID=1903181 RepID=A0A1Q6DWN4_METT1|nr:MAG: CRISPR-associated helicase Cas3 [Candidatus Methanohalarchaeum thermophilum]
MSYSRFLSHENKKLKDHLEEVKSNSFSIIDNLDISKKEDLERVIKIVSVSHDFGKFSDYFQKKIRNNSSEEKYERHGLISSLFGLFLAERFEFDEIERGFVNAVVFNSIKHHHGDLENLEKTIKYETDSKESSYKDTRKIYENIEKHKPRVNKIYNLLLETKDIDYLEEFKDYLGKITAQKKDNEIIIPGLVRFTEFNDDIFYFYLFNLVYSILLESDKKSASEVEKTKEDYSYPIEMLESYKKGFDQTDEFNKVREAIYQETAENLEAALKESNDRFFEIDAPTGSGKTLTLLGNALKLRNHLKESENKEPSIIYALPYISIIEQNYEVFKNVLNTRYDEIDNNKLLEHHHLSNEVFNKDGEELGYDKSSFLIENWYSDIVVTTFFQVFKSIFTNKNHLLKKYNKLTNSIILIDEIQAIPPSLITPIRDCFKILTEKFDSYIILATATQPKLNSTNEQKEKRLDSTKLFSPRDYSSLSNKKINKFFNRYKVKTNLINEKTNLEELYDLINHDSGFDNLMVVLNTIDSTKKLFSKFNKKNDFNGFEIIYLSTNIPPGERLERIKKAKDYIGNNKKFILITTQLIEAGVDISVDKIYRDLAPLDNLVQTAGRTNRNNEKDFSEIHILNLVDKENNDYPFSKYIYGEILLEKTRKFLKKKNEFSERELVEEYLPNYFGEVVDDKAQGVKTTTSGNEIDLNQEIKNLNYRTIENHFKLIEDNLPEVSIFVLDDTKSRNLWERYIDIFSRGIGSFEDYLERKKEFSKIKKDFNRQVVTLKVNSKQELVDFKSKVGVESDQNIGTVECNGIICLDAESGFYDEQTGVQFDLEKKDIFQI